MSITRFHVLHRRFVKLVNAEPAAIEPQIVRKLIADTDAYFAVPRDPDLPAELSAFYVRSAIRTRAEHLAETSRGLAWHADMAALVERLPSGEVLPNGARFTSDYVTLHQARWFESLRSLAGQPELRGLEVGSYEGRSCIWFLDTILTHPTSRMTCIDSFDFGGQGASVVSPELRGPGLQDRFDGNLAAAGHEGRVTKIHGRSQEQLRRLPLGEYHFAYIDGSHLTCDVLEDVVLTWRLLRLGGVMILDDYGYDRNHESDPTARPGAAIDAFTGCFAGHWTELFRGYQLILRKDVA